MPNPAAETATKLAAEFEDYRAFPYPDPGSALYRAAPRERWGFEPAAVILARLPANVRTLSGAPWTVGFGSTGPTITPNSPEWSRGVAMANLEARFEAHVDLIAKRSTRRLSCNQLAALALFLDNVGPGGARKDGLFQLRSGRPSTLWSLVCAGKDDLAANAFLAWTRAQGRVLAGLVRRRNVERTLYLRGN